jgi:hypothetical protein
VERESDSSIDKDDEEYQEDSDKPCLGFRVQGFSSLNEDDEEYQEDSDKPREEWIRRHGCDARVRMVS